MSQDRPLSPNQGQTTETEKCVSGTPRDPLNLDTLYHVIEALPVAVYIMDKTGTIVYGNPAGKQIWKGIRYVGPEEFCAYEAWWHETGKKIEAHQWAGSRAIHNGETSSDEVIRIKCFDGSEKIISNSAMPLRDEKGAIIGAIAINRDITREIENSARLRKSEQRYRRTLDHLLEGIQILDNDWRYLYINHSAELHNRRPREELLGHRYMDEWPETRGSAIFQSIEQCFIDRKARQLEQELQFPDGDIGVFQWSIQPMEEGMLIMSVDNTHRKQTDSQLQRHQRLESLGYLAGGIAHDFNNLFGGIYGNVDLAIAESSEPAIIELLQNSIRTIDRARLLTRQLITFSQGGTPNRNPGNLFPLLADVAMNCSEGTGVTVQLDIDDDLKQASFDCEQISQVMENVVTNAVESMQPNSVLKIRARNWKSGHSPILHPRGGYIRVSVVDSGVGITAEDIDKVFDPFFTTKETGRGLGLSTCYSILQRHEGAIEIESVPLQGTTVHFYLPAVHFESIHPQPETTAHPESRILFMDDDDVIRMATQAMIKRLGYTVTCVKEGKEAFELFCRKSGTPDAYHAVILDLTVPGGWGGMQTVSEIRKLNPDIPIFVASGYMDVPVMKNPADFGFNGSISKPYRFEDLAALLNNVFTSHTPDGDTP
jgi:signal transduction histidine kinase/ActR/RegA family two-component response regulator